MQYVADVQCATCRERYPVRHRSQINKPCVHCKSHEISLVKTYGRIDDTEQNIPMWCVDCHQRKDATSWRQACDLCDCGGDRVPTYLLPHFDHPKPHDVPAVTAVPWTKDSVVKKIAALEVPRVRNDTTSFTGQVKSAFLKGYHASRNT